MFINSESATAPTGFCLGCRSRRNWLRRPS